MNDDRKAEITQILHDWNSGNEGAKELLLPYVYDELRRQARYLMSNERPNHTLQPTALVHEAFVKLVDQGSIEWQDRRHFYGIMSRLMRQVLIDHARKHSAEKRGKRPVHFSIDDVELPVEERAESILFVDEALTRLGQIDGQQASIVEMRFFGGFSNKEIADALDVSERTVGRDWNSAKLWLTRELTRL